MAKKKPAKEEHQEKKEIPEESEEKLCCGLVMPISAIDGCDEQHWIDVKAILTDAIKDADFEARLVSYADDVGIIQKRIIQNLYDNPIIVCDVSGKNPNVMFELGMRLAFDKPTVIVKDDQTTYSFDTSPIEHLGYPRDLRFPNIVEFKKILREKIKATFNQSQNDHEYTTFLKHFGKFTVSKLETKELSKEDYIIEELRDLKRHVQHRVLTPRGDAFFQKNPHLYPTSELQQLALAMSNEINAVIASEFPTMLPPALHSEESKDEVFEALLRSNKEIYSKYANHGFPLRLIFNAAYDNAISLE